MVNVGILCHRKSLLEDVATYAKIRCLFYGALSKKIKPPPQVEKLNSASILVQFRLTSHCSRLVCEIYTHRQRQHKLKVLQIKGEFTLARIKIR